jgi:hypothetical protein
MQRKKKPICATTRCSAISPYCSLIKAINEFSMHPLNHFKDFDENGYGNLTSRIVQKF